MQVALDLSAYGHVHMPVIYTQMAIYLCADKCMSDQFYLQMGNKVAPTGIKCIGNT